MDHLSGRDAALCNRALACDRLVQACSTAGEIYVEPIGIPAALHRAFDPAVGADVPSDWQNLLDKLQ